MIRKSGAVQGMEVADRAKASDSRSTFVDSATLRDRVGLHRLVERQAQQSPAAPAIRCGARLLSYEQLWREVESLACHFQNEGIGRGDLVAIMLTSTLDSIVAMLATMHAGAAYLPLDPTQPAARLEEIIANADPALLLLDMQSETVLPWIGCPLLVIEPRSPSRQTATPIEVTVGETDLAYVIYTSGTTGVPKGVEITHAGAVYSTETRIAYYGDPPERFLLLSPVTFDSSVAGIYWTLATGGELIIPDVPVSEAAVHLHDLIDEYRITHLLCIASLWNQVLAAGTREQLESLRVVIVAGEACPPRLPANHFAMLPDARLFNEYGPTEATVWCMVDELTPDDATGSISIGRAIEGSKVYLLDANRRPVADGVPGEIHIAGAGIAAGYRNHPELTAERFITNPIENGRFSRMYRTGDMARRRDDGRLEFIGRRDNQVKVRGFRIELGEIESTLMRLPIVDEAAVIVDGNHVIAYLMPAAENDLVADDRTVRSHVAEHLPAYMQPTRYVVLDQLPRTKHGKVDRAALQGMEKTTLLAEPPAGNNAPRNEYEAELLTIFADVLEQPIGIDDDFFQRGGDSLSSIDLIARIEQKWQRPIMLSQLMQSPTVAKLAGCLKEVSSSIGNDGLIELRSGDSTAPLVLLPPGGGGMVCYVDLLRELRMTRPILGIQARGLESDAPPHSSVEEMVDHYWELIRRERPTGEVHLAGWSFGGVVAYALAARLESEGLRAASVTMLDCGMVYSFYVLRRLFPDQEIPLYLLNSADREQFVSYFLRQGVEAGIVPPGANDAQARRILDVFAAGVSATADYRPSGYSGKLHLLAASERWCEPRRTPEREWRKVSDKLDSTLVPGDHLSMLHRPNVAELARAMEQIVEQAAESDR